MEAAAQNWYVVHTHARAEEAALRNLERQGFSAYLPQYRKRRRHARRIDLIKAPLFPRYLFVAMDIARSRWRAVSSTIGVSHLICNGEAPARVPGGIVEDIRRRHDADGLIPVAREQKFSAGEVVQVTAGALADQVGLFERMADDERVVLLLDLLGRRIKVKLPIEIVAPFA